jgi:hypothetical protein
MLGNNELLDKRYDSITLTFKGKVSGPLFFKDYKLGD